MTRLELVEKEIKDLKQRLAVLEKKPVEKTEKPYERVKTQVGEV